MPQCKYGDEATRATAKERTIRRHNAKQCICHGNRITYKKFKVRQNRRGGKLLVLDSRWMTTWDTKTTRIRVPFEDIR